MLSYDQEAEAIEAEGRKLGKLVEDLGKLAHDAAVAEADYKTQFATARVTYRDFAAQEGIRTTVDQVEDHATLECSESRRTYLLAQSAMTVQREALRATQARLDGLRSLASGYRQAGG